MISVATQRRQWSIPPSVLAGRVNKRIEDWVRLFILTMFTRVVVRSPVDSGRFRANWAIGYGTVNEATTEDTDLTGAVKTGEIQAAVLRYNLGGSIFLTNSLPYAAALEYGNYPNPPKFGSKKRGEDSMAIHVIGGYSMQAPEGMVRITVAEMEQASVEAAREAAA